MEWIGLERNVSHCKRGQRWGCKDKPNESSLATAVANVSSQGINAGARCPLQVGAARLQLRSFSKFGAHVLVRAVLTEKAL